MNPAVQQKTSIHQMEHKTHSPKIFTCIPTLSGSILLAGPPSTFIIAVRMVGATKLGECPTLFQLGETIRRHTTRPVLQADCACASGLVPPLAPPVPVPIPALSLLSEQPQLLLQSQKAQLFVQSWQSQLSLQPHQS
ncbi:hypothetical protein EMCRGX_G009937 [Ephydatia muelleri]